MHNHLSLKLILAAFILVPKAQAVDFVLYPNTPIPVANVIGNRTSFAPGFFSGSWQANATVAGQKQELYLPATAVFPGYPGGVKISDIASVSYWTNKSGTVAQPDWYLLLYTVKTLSGDTGSFYHSRLTTEPAYTGTPAANAPPNVWHQWATGDPSFPLKFYDSIRNGGIFGGIASDPTLATLQAGPITWGPPGLVTPTDYRSEVISLFSIQTGTCCAFGFNGLVDGLTITLKTGEVSRINLEAVPLDSPFQIRYASNLTAGDSVINISNNGANGAPIAGPGFGGGVGNICVNAYAFSPDEQLISCCSCLVTPNGLVSLSIKTDLVSNTLTGVIPDSVVIKLVSTGAGANFTSLSCANSAALPGTPNFPLASGLHAWGTTIHLDPAGKYTVNETPFAGATLSADELASIANRCTNIVGNGSGFGACKVCRNTGLSSLRQ